MYSCVCAEKSIGSRSDMLTHSGFHINCQGSKVESFVTFTAVTLSCLTMWVCVCVFVCKMAMNSAKDRR